MNYKATKEQLNNILILTGEFPVKHSDVIQAIRNIVKDIFTNEIKEEVKVEIKK